MDQPRLGYIVRRQIFLVGLRTRANSLELNNTIRYEMPFLFLIQVSLYGFPRLFTVT